MSFPPRLPTRTVIAQLLGVLSMTSTVFVGLDWPCTPRGMRYRCNGQGARPLRGCSQPRRLAELLRRLARFGACLRIAIERPSV